jgi:hypothetical protein
VKTLLVGFMLALPLLAGKRIVMEGTQGQTKVRTELLLDGTRMRLNDGRGGATLVTRNGEIYEVLILDTAKRQYFSMDKSYVDSLAAFFVKVQKQMEDLAQKLPPEMREQFKKTTTIQTPGFRYEEGGTDQVDGVRCIVFEQFVGEKKSLETCVANPLDLGISLEEYRIVSGFGDYQLKMMEGLRETSMGAMLDNLELALMMNPELRGVPLRARSLQNAALDYSERLISVEDAVFPDADFSVGDAVRVEAPSLNLPSLPRP